MAQWKRAGPITQSSEDQNLALLVYLLLLKRMSEDDKRLVIYFSPIKLKKNDATGDKRGRMRATEISICHIWPYQVTYLCPRVKSLVFNMISCF